MGEKREKKKNSWERWTSRQTDSLEKQAHQPPPCTHHAPQTPACGSWVSFAEMGRGEPLPEAWGCWMVSHYSLREGLPYSWTLLQACSLLMGKSQRREHRVSEGDSGMCEARW